MNPQGCHVWSFRVPSAEETSHDFLWRYHHKAPARGMIAIFNRSHYEDVLAVRVKGLVEEEVWRPRYEAIRDFERGLAREGVVLLKFFLHITRDEQKRRLERRIQDPAKHWKFNPNDLRERAAWDDYQRAYEDAINATSTDEAPWLVVPANHKWFRNLVLARTIADTARGARPALPGPGAGHRALRRAGLALRGQADRLVARRGPAEQVLHPGDREEPLDLRGAPDEHERGEARRLGAAPALGDEGGQTRRVDEREPGEVEDGGAVARPEDVAEPGGAREVELARGDEHEHVALALGADLEVGGRRRHGPESTRDPGG